MEAAGAAAEVPAGAVAEVPARCLRFFNYTEEAYDGAISNQQVKHGATLAAKYKGARFYGEDVREGTYYRIRADLVSWAGKKGGSWRATCGEVPSGGPSEGPVEDKKRPGEHDPEVYNINGTLHGMITEADQAPGMAMEARRGRGRGRGRGKGGRKLPWHSAEMAQHRGKVATCGVDERKRATHNRNRDFLLPFPCLFVV